MASQIYSVSPNSYANCDTFGTTVTQYDANQSYGPIKVGASGSITEDFWGDISGYWYQGGQPENNCRFYGDNGRDHFAIFKFGGGSGRYIGKQVTGLTFRENNDSTAGRGMYIFRYGIQITSRTSSTYEMYDLSGKMSRPSSYGKTHTKTFNSTLQNRLNSGDWFIEKLLVEVSTAGGTGTRATNTTISNLKFNVKSSGLSSAYKLILPAKRPYSSRNDTMRIG